MRRSPSSISPQCTITGITGACVFGSGFSHVDSSISMSPDKDGGGVGPVLLELPTTPPLEKPSTLLRQQNSSTSSLNLDEKTATSTEPSTSTTPARAATKRRRDPTDPESRIVTLRQDVDVLALQRALQRSRRAPYKPRSRSFGRSRGRFRAAPRRRSFSGFKSRGRSFSRFGRARRY